MLSLAPELAARFEGDDAFDRIMRLEGEVYRAQKNRRTSRVMIGDRAYFVKQHGATSWRELLKNALRGRWPVLTARPPGS